MRALLILIFVISFSAKIMVLDGKDSGLNEIDARLLEVVKIPDELDEVFQDFFEELLRQSILRNFDHPLC